MNPETLEQARALGEKVASTMKENYDGEVSNTILCL